MQDPGVAIVAEQQAAEQVAEQVLVAAERLEVTLRTERSVPEHLLKHFAKRIWELRAAIGCPDRMRTKLHQRMVVVQNNMDVLDHYCAGGFRFENRGVNLPLLPEEQGHQPGLSSSPGLGEGLG
jgi:tetraacyldisaccharide-1-P 4'-kinase